YEKVIKVKADVAAILKFSPFDSQLEADPLDAASGAHRGDTQGGVQRSALKPPWRGEPRHRWVPALLAGTQAARRVGETRPPPRPPRLPPGRGERERGR